MITEQELGSPCNLAACKVECPFVSLWQVAVQIDALPVMDPVSFPCIGPKMHVLK